jgi:hypothetical protein
MQPPDVVGKLLYRSCKSFRHIVRGTASYLASARFPQEKVLQDKLTIAGRKRRTASLAI